LGQILLINDIIWLLRNNIIFVGIIEDFAKDRKIIHKDKIFAIFIKILARFLRPKYIKKLEQEVYFLTHIIPG